METTKIALVTGGNRGIGAAIAHGLAEHGMTVVIGARDPHAGEEAARRIGGRSVPLDVTDDVSVRDAAARIEEWYGKLDVLVNNAGVSGGLDGQQVGEVDLAVVRAVYETNLFGVFRVTETFLPLLRTAGAARIVNVSSGTASLAWQSDPAHKYATSRIAVAYPSSKAALNMLTVMYAKGLAADGISVNAIAPGACATDFAAGLGLSLERTAEQGAAIAVRLATAPESPTGSFLEDAGTVPW
jgi:NAD(P)-dependent dehydrogenase (short-subunit alcohol dehydrogenase family)